MEQAVLDFILGLVKDYPLAATAVIVIGVARAVFKPLVSVADAYALSTPDPVDDEVVAKFKTGKIYWLLDYVLSLKIPK